MNARGDAAATTPHRATRHFWWVAVAVLALWWPISPWLQSDDWIAVDYVRDTANVADDFAGNQYGLEGLVRFYRPLITASFAADVALSDHTTAGIAFATHLGNACAFALAAALLAGIVARLLGAAAAWPAALWFALGAQHAGSVSWAVGRVDSHTIVWILLCVFAWLRSLDAAASRPRRWRIVAVVACVLALASKELAIVTPLLAALLAFAHGGTRTLAERTSATLRTWPLFAVLAAYLGLRLALFGAIGGYDGPSAAPVATAAGFAIWTARVVAPGLVPFGGSTLGVLGAVALAVPALLAIANAFRRAPRRALAFAIAYALCCVPIFQFLAATDEAKNFRYLTLASAAIACLVAATPRLAWFAVLGAVPVFVATRIETWHAHRVARDLHVSLHAAAADAPITDTPLFVTGLPRTDTSGRTILYHLGVDRLLLPPHGRGHVVHALRSLAPRVDAFTFDARTVRIPGAHVVDLIRDETTGAVRASLRPPPARDEGGFDVRLDGPSHWSTQVFFELHDRSRRIALVAARKASHYRITILTAGGHLSTVLSDDAPPDAPEGRVDALRWLTSGRFAATGDDAFVTLGLTVPATLDRMTTFPVLVEAGTGDGAAFVPAATANALLRIQLDRDYADFVAGRVPDPRSK